MTTPIYDAAEKRTRETFLALMWSLSYPGKVHHLPEDERDSFVLIAETLLDLETTYTTHDEILEAFIATTGTRRAEIDRAAYVFYPTLTEADLEALKHANTGTIFYPDESATLILGAKLKVGDAMNLTGPGIKAETSLQIGGLPTAFWELRQRVIRYPLGWDVLLVDGRQVIGLPRTTVIEMGAQ